MAFYKYSKVLCHNNGLQVFQIEWLFATLLITQNLVNTIRTSGLKVEFPIIHKFKATMLLEFNDFIIYVLFIKMNYGLHLFIILLKM